MKEEFKNHTSVWEGIIALKMEYTFFQLSVINLNVDITNSYIAKNQWNIMEPTIKPSSLSTWKWFIYLFFWSSLLPSLACWRSSAACPRNSVISLGIGVVALLDTFNFFVEVFINFFKIYWFCLSVLIWQAFFCQVFFSPTLLFYFYV